MFSENTESGLDNLGPLAEKLCRCACCVSPGRLACTGRPGAPLESGAGQGDKGRCEIKPSLHMLSP